MQTPFKSYNPLLQSQLFPDLLEAHYVHDVPSLQELHLFKHYKQDPFDS